MKKTLILLLLLFIQNSIAAPYEWETMASCENGKLIVQKICYPYRGSSCYTHEQQVVIKDANILEYFVSKSAYGHYSMNEGRFIHRGKPELLLRDTRVFDWGYAARYLASIRIPYADDTYTVSYYFNWGTNNESLYLKAFNHSNNTDPYIMQHGELANWKFENCKKF